MRIIASIFVVVLIPIAFLFDYRSKGIAAGDEDKYHIVLDAGHGGIDNGAVVNVIKEADINLSIVRLLKTELEARNFRVSLTREGTESLEEPFAKNKKVSDMANRRKKITELNPSLVISIHQNKFPNTAVRGLQCFYASETEGSEVFANAVQKQFNENKEFKTNKIVKRTDFNLCEHSTVPAILIECGFLSNGEERALLTTKLYQEKIAINIAVALANIIIQHWYFSA
ncbi:MAG: N-acetylmuramoyl-L-alanine amidase [Christensenellaceae bacterium]|jgi:N-acetylmuramoyl-L-alanine amidase|nr:N-acetylmuramoyl-L-alanine amidase [Christensenellaceae bacterium]